MLVGLKGLVEPAKERDRVDREIKKTDSASRVIRSALRVHDRAVGLSSSLNPLKVVLPGLCLTAAVTSGNYRW